MLSRRTSKLALSIAAVALVGFDGDGCNGGPNGPATKFCQDTLARANLPDADARLFPSCAQCCIQEVPYKGRIENGLCVCR